MRDALSRDSDQNPHTITGPGLGLYEPTRDTLKAIQPYVTRGSVLAFDQLTHAKWPGETAALPDTPVSITATCTCYPEVPHRPI